MAPAGKPQSQAHESGVRHGPHLSVGEQKPESDFGLQIKALKNSPMG
jgi:hypothetical protein